MADAHRGDPPVRVVLQRHAPAGRVPAPHELAALVVVVARDELEAAACLRVPQDRAALVVRELRRAGAVRRARDAPQGVVLEAARRGPTSIPARRRCPAPSRESRTIDSSGRRIDDEPVRAVVLVAVLEPRERRLADEVAGRVVLERAPLARGVLHPAHPEERVVAHGPARAVRQHLLDERAGHVAVLRAAAARGTRSPCAARARPNACSVR